MNYSKIWLTVVALAASAFMMPGVLDPYQTPRLVLLSLLAVHLLFRRSSKRSSMEFEILIGLMCWVIVASFSRDHGYSLVGSYLAPFDSFTAVITYAGIAIGVARLGCSVEDSMAAICAASVPVSAYAIFQRIVLDRDPFLVHEYMHLPDVTRVISTQGSPVYLGALLAIAAAVSLALLARGKGNRNLALVTLGLAIPAILATGTRGAALAVLAAAFALVKNKKKWLAVPFAVGVMIGRHHSFNSDAARLETFKIAWKIFLAHPIVGVGPGVYTAAARQFITYTYIAANHNSLIAPQHAHNQVLQVLAEGGIVGLIGFSVILMGAWKAVSKNQDRAGLLAVAAAYAVVASLNPIPHSVTFLMIILIASASSTKFTNPERLISIGLAGLCLVAAFLSGRILVANYCMMHASLTRDPARVSRLMDLASSANPWELRVADRYSNLQLALAGQDREKAKAAVANGIEAAHQGVLNHPEDSSAHEVYGRMVLLGVMAGLHEDPNEAMMAYDEAQRLAPTFTPIMRRRISLANALGRRAKAAEATSELQKIVILEGI